jgi:nucleotidyltransferase substrate binding protein (TIGR01987 family)
MIHTSTPGHLAIWQAVGRIREYNAIHTNRSTIMKHRLQERSSDFLSAVSRLGEALAEPESSFLRDATIQRFEFTYELAWKAMKLWLEAKDIVVLNAKDTLQAAVQQGLLENGNAWSELHRMRNLTSHTYDEAQARTVYVFVRDEGIHLFTALAEKVRSWI